MAYGLDYLCAQIVTVPAVALAWQMILPQISPKFQLFGSYANSPNFYSKDFAENAIILGMIMVFLTTTINVRAQRAFQDQQHRGPADSSGLSGLVIIFLIHAAPQPGRRAHQHGRYRCQSPVGVLRRAPDRGHHAALRDVRLRHGRSLAEETDDPRRRAPRAICRRWPRAGVIGFLLIVFGTMAVSDKLYADPTSLGLVAITKDVLGETWGNIFLIDCALAIFVCCLAIHAMSVRILFAMGRDNNLPGGSRLASVSGKRRVPVFPALLVGAIAMLILAFNIYNQYAFEVIVALGIIFMYLAYLGVTIPLLRQRLGGWPGNLPTASMGLFSLGRWAILTNAIAIFYGASMAVNLAWPREEFYGAKWYQHYGPITGIVVVMGAGLILYYGYQQHRMEILPEHRADALAPPDAQAAPGTL